VPPAPPEEPTGPTIAVGVLTSASNSSYLERLAENANGWHRDFPGLRVFTYDAPPRPGARFPFAIEPIPMLPGEVHGSQGVGAVGGSLFPIFQRLHARAPRADYYLVADDDTVVYRPNLLAAIAALERRQARRGQAAGAPFFTGKCSQLLWRGEPHEFVVGGAGTLLNNAMATLLAPLFDVCRVRYRHIVFSDARLGACVHKELATGMSWPGAPCAPWGFAFTNGRVEDEHRWYTREERGARRDHRVVTLHEKAPARLRVINGWLAGRRRAGAPVAWSTLAPLLRLLAPTLAGEARAHRDCWAPCGEKGGACAWCGGGGGDGMCCRRGWPVPGDARRPDGDRCRPGMGCEKTHCCTHKKWIHPGGGSGERDEVDAKIYARRRKAKTTARQAFLPPTDPPSNKNECSILRTVTPGIKGALLPTYITKPRVTQQLLEIIVHQVMHCR
jgi:hypothetical protein